STNLQLKKLFSKYVDRTSIHSWNSVISELARSGDSEEALKAFSSLRKSALKPNRASFPCTIKSCAAIADLTSGKQAHQQSFVFGYASDLFVSSALIDMYSKCGRLCDARNVFDEIPLRNVVSWTSIINGYARNNCPVEALLLFKRQLIEEGEAVVVSDYHRIDGIAMVPVLTACSCASDKNVTRSIHGFLIQRGLMADVVIGNSLIEAYARNGDVGISMEVFDEMSDRDVISWNSIIAVCAQNGFSLEAIAIFRSMLQSLEVEFNALTLSAVLLACAHSGSLQMGKTLHAQAMKMRLGSDVFVGTSIIDMYCKCGRVTNARKAFDAMEIRNVKSWSAMIAGYGMHGSAKEALGLLADMILDGIKPNAITFVSILSACCHAGLVDEGWHWFCTMQHRFDVEPSVEHYGCMVDLFGRAGQLNRAYDLVSKMGPEPDCVIWSSLLAAARMHKNVEIGELSARKLFELDRNNSGYYTLMSNIYADARRWDDAKRMRAHMKRDGVSKSPGFSLVETKGGRVHVFVAGDRNHPQIEKIYGYLEELSARLREEGYVARVDSVVHDVDEEEKGIVVRVHSEKLAVVFGVMNSAPGTTVQVLKNLRTCEDCHVTMKLISKVTQREIVVRDPKRFHHFRQGDCSCGDYW
ncbi:hypothetical protein M569_17191, partial [Genlisea aurea]